MRRRILAAIISVTVVAVAGFGVPFALAARRVYQQDALSRLQSEVALAGASVPATFQTSADPVELPASTREVAIGLYDPGGGRLSGQGPSRGDAPVLKAAQGQVSQRSGGGLIVLAAPLTSEEVVYAVVRASMPQSVVTQRAGRAWLFMGLLGLAVIALAALAGGRIAGRLSRPVGDLARAAERLGSGDFTVRTGRSGIPEVDSVAINLDSTAQRLGDLVSRERAFSADASHQLRTPLTGLRLQLETALANPRRRQEAIDIALGEVDRLEATIDHLLALARGLPTEQATVDLAEVLDQVRQAWNGPLAARGRPLRVAADPDTPNPQASANALRQILDVLVGNAAEHGAGPVAVHGRPAPGGMAIDVSDEGPGIAGDPQAVFRRRSGHGRGIGLPLARSLAEAEGGRLVLPEAGPRPTFTLVLPAQD